MSDKVREYVQLWLDKANSDLKNAEIILTAQVESPPLDTVCFHCQQAVEKFIKAFLADLTSLVQKLLDHFSLPIPASRARTMAWARSATCSLLKILEI